MVCVIACVEFGWGWIWGSSRGQAEIQAEGWALRVWTTQGRSGLEQGGYQGRLGPPIRGDWIGLGLETIGGDWGSGAIGGDLAWDWGRVGAIRACARVRSRYWVVILRAGELD